MSTPADRLRMGAEIVKFEARRDKQGRIAVYALPSDDGGGAYEIAGINERYHRDEAAYLRTLILDGQFDKAEQLAGAYIATYTDTVAFWTGKSPIEFYLRDSAFNRGRRGATLILQIALGVAKDGIVGPATLGALAKAEKKDATAVLTALRAARETYERNYVGRHEGNKFWKGLVNRWNKAFTTAQTF